MHEGPQGRKVDITSNPAHQTLYYVSGGGAFVPFGVWAESPEAAGQAVRTAMRRMHDLSFGLAHQEATAAEWALPVEYLKQQIQVHVHPASAAEYLRLGALQMRDPAKLPPGEDA